VKLINCTNKDILKRKVFGLACALFVLAFPYFIILTGGADNIEEKQSYCPHKMLTGLPCPGCGITKSFTAIYQGELLKSFQAHLLGIPSLLMAFFMVVVFSMEITTGKEYFDGFLYSKKLAYIIAIVLAVYHLVRTIYFVVTHSFHEILKESIWM